MNKTMVQIAMGRLHSSLNNNGAKKRKLLFSFLQFLSSNNLKEHFLRKFSKIFST